MSETEQGPPAPDVDETGIIEIADGVWVIPDRRVPLVPNIGIVEGEDAVLVVDTAMGPQNGARVLAVAKEKAEGRRMLATSTHFHPEHGFGLQVFRPEATIVYNRSQLEELHLKGESYVGLFRTFGPNVEAALEGVELVEPHVVYGGEADIDLGGRRVHFRARGLAHTRGDQIVFLPEQRILFTGDLVESRVFPIYPYFPPDDTDVNGSAWIEVLRWLEGFEPEVVVPGHGELGDIGLITTARVYHELLREETFQLADAGLEADAAVAELEPAMLERYPDWEQPEWVSFGIRCFHAERDAADR